LLNTHTASDLFVLVDQRLAKENISTVKFDATAGVRLWGVSTTKSAKVMGSLEQLIT
jgi:hypothetical protein